MVSFGRDEKGVDYLIDSCEASLGTATLEAQLKVRGATTYSKTHMSRMTAYS